jgi:glycerophosphoryl diester phosphodiesterase
MPGANVLCDPNARLVVAHRGNRVAAPENTMESLTQALEMGVDAIEFDVRVTKDGVAVVLHDAELDRTTNGHGNLNAYSFAEVRSLDAGARSPMAGGRRHVIPSLEEVLDRFREIPLVIEVKEFAAAEVTEQFVRRFGAHDRVLIGSAENDVIERFYRSGLRTCASKRDAMLLIPLALAHITPPKARYDVLSVTPNYHGLPLPVRSMAAAARRAGIATQVWTVNDPVQATALWAAGVAGIVTDDPAALLGVRPR